MKVRLGDICTVVSGSTPKSTVPEYWDGDIKWITPAELSDDTYIINDSARHITALGVAKTGLKSFPAGTVILSSRAPIGKTAIAGCEMFCNQGFKNFICSEKIDSKYLNYFLSGKTDYLNSLGRGATFKEISKAIVENIEITLPEIEEQKRIAARFERLMRLIQLQKTELEELDKLVKSRFIELFGDLVIGNKVDTNKKRIGEIASVTKLAGFEFTKYIQYKEHGDIIMLRGLNCKKGHLILDDIKWIDKETSDLLPRSKLYYGDILMTYAGTIGDVAMVDANDKYHLAPNVAKITINDMNAYNPVFLMHLFMYTNDYIMTFASVVAQASINMEKIRGFEYYFPPIEKQNQFAAFVEQTDKSKYYSSLSLRYCQAAANTYRQEWMTCQTSDF